MAESVTFAKASNAGRDLRSDSTPHERRSEAGSILATWRWQGAK
jgi:hypothetical protein